MPRLCVITYVAELGKQLVSSIPRNVYRQRAIIVSLKSVEAPQHDTIYVCNGRKRDTSRSCFGKTLVALANNEP